MLIKLLVLVLLAAVVWRLLKNSDGASADKLKAHLRRLAVPGLLLLLVLLVVSGHLSWLVALGASLFAAIKAALPWLLRALPLLSARQQRQQQNEQQQQRPQAANDHGEMGVDEACALLDLSPTALCRDDIIRSHRRLMQKVHPDRGGSDYLAGRINLARDILLKYLQQKDQG